MYHPFHRHGHHHDEEHRAMGRHHGGRGFGHFAAGFMGGNGLGGQGFRTGRKLASADLQLLILALLEQKPSHGYELIKALEERSQGFYSPSPGMVYPALTYLEEIGHATVEVAGTKKLYQITSDGLAHLEKNRATVEAIFAQLSQIGQKMEQVREVFAGDEASGDEDADHDIRQARRALKLALHDKKRSSPEEYRRVAAILHRAAEEILKGKRT
ncbi:MAG: PadR family transcriptional regulator [Stenotrophobium sp.]